MYKEFLDLNLDIYLILGINLLPFSAHNMFISINC